METFEQFMESKDKDTRKISAIMDIAQALQKIFKDYSIETRKYAWKKITTGKGEKLVNDLLKTPKQSLSPFRTLVP